jgi:chaperonin cofactor prefoldin
MDKRLKTNLKRRIVNATARLDYDYRFITEERDEYSTKIANVTYSPGEKMYGLEFEQFRKKANKYVTVGPVLVNLTLEKVLEEVEDFLDTTPLFLKGK